MNGLGLVDFARDELGIALTPAQHEMLESFAAGGFSQAVWRCGRRGGKSLLADILALADVGLRDDLRTAMRPGETRVAAIIAPRLEQAAAHIDRCAQLVEHSAALRSLLLERTVYELTFANLVAIRAYPCSARSIRGDAWSLCVLDELAHFQDATYGPAAGDRVYEAALPSLAQFGDQGWLVAISTPLWRSGIFHTLVERAASGRFPQMHYRHLSTMAMNPRVPAEWLRQQQHADPDLFTREFEAQFVDGASSFLSSADVIACRRQANKLGPVAAVEYFGSIDPAFSRDAFILAIGHQDADERVIVDGTWSWVRAGYERTLDEVRTTCQLYRIASLETDQFCAVPVVEGLQRRGIHVRQNDWTNDTKWRAFSRLKAALATRSVELPNDEAVIEELISLEARPTPSGLTRIAATGSAHDDRATAIAALVHALADDGPSMYIPSASAMAVARNWSNLGAGQSDADLRRPGRFGPYEYDPAITFVTWGEDRSW